MLGVELSSTLERALGAGHPWVYRDQVPSGFAAATGAWVRVRAGRFSGYGIWDDDSPLALRIFSTKGVPDRAWVHERVAAAWALREPIRSRGDTTCHRWVNGEGDGLPGIVVDWYGDYAVLVTDSPALEGLVPLVLACLNEVASLTGVLRRRRSRDVSGPEVASGKAPPASLVTVESGLSFVVDLVVGQKTGLFLDQRENRRTVETLSAGRRVLNLFSYTGGFSLYAARGRATRVTSVDISPGATETARRSFEQSGFDPGAHDFLARDVFEFLEEQRDAKARYDLVVCDPPSFARKQSQVEGAERAYTRVNAAALGLVADGGLLASASCTSRVGPAAFLRCLADAAQRAGRRLQILHEAGHALDHPILVGHPEGRYLHFVVGRVTGRV